MAAPTTADAKQGLENGAAGHDQRLFLIDGPSLVYRAFYALPESIATSTGEPTNAIFGFASMLVKIVTDYGVRPTIVAWDAGTSGRTEIFAEYKATRRSRPDLLKAQWPAMEPLVEAFGYRNVKLEGFEADDVIASLAERARAAGVATMIVTGDRDVFQLIDDAGLVKVMATSRGITETKIYDRRAVLDRYGIPPELIPDFYGLKGDSSDNIPGVPGIGDKTASELIRAYGSLDGVLEHVADIGGAKRKQNLLEHSEDARTSKRLATVRRDLEVEIDLGAEASREPDRSRLREFFRRYELRDPLRRLEEALGDPELAAARSAPAEGATLRARARAGTPQDIGAFGPTQALCVVVRAREAPEGALFAEGSPWRFAVTPADPGGSGGPDGAPGKARRAKRGAPAEVLTGDCAGPEEIVAMCADRPVLVHDAKALREVPPRLAHDTLLGAYLLEPARRSYPFAELCEERGLQSESDDPLAADAVLLDALASWQRAEIGERGLERLMAEIELPLVAVLRAMEEIGVRLNCERLAEITGRVSEEIVELEGEIFALAGRGVPDRLAPAAGGGAVREARPLAQAPRQDRLLDRRARAAGDPLRARDRVPDRALARAQHADQDIPGRAARARRSALAHPHDLPADGRADRAPVEHQPEHAERPDQDRARQGDPRLLRGGAGRAADLRRLLADRAARARLRGRRAGAEGDLRARRRRAHRDRLAGVRRDARRDRPRHALEVEDDQLRHRLRPVGLWPRRPPEHPARRRPRSSSTPICSASRGWRRSSRARSSVPARRVT